MHIFFGLAAVLHQNQDWIDRVIGYVSRVLSKTKHKYPVHKFEFLALKWAITEQFHEYLYGNTFVVYTDNNPLTYTLISVKFVTTGCCWVASLAKYNFSLSYKSGKVNVDGDALSHIPREDHDQHIEADTVWALISNVTQGTTLIGTYSYNIQVTKTLNMQKDPKVMSQKDWIIA